MIREKESFSCRLQFGIKGTKMIPFKNSKKVKKVLDNCVRI